VGLKIFLLFDFAMVGFVLDGVLEIFKILLPRLGSYRVSRFFWIFDFFVFDFLIFDFSFFIFRFRVGRDRFFSLLLVLSREGMGVAGSSNFAFESFKTFLLLLFIMLLFQVDSFSILFKRTMRGEPLAIFFRKARFWPSESNGGSPKV